MIIWCFGDSWTWGSELWNKEICSEDDALYHWGNDYSVACELNHDYVMKKNWGACLSKIGDYEVSNFAIPGSSNRQILETLYYQLKSEEKPDIIIIGWSTQYRWAERKNNHTSQMRAVDKFQSVLRDYPDLFYEDNFFNEVCTAHWLSNGIPIINVNAFYKNAINNDFDDRINFIDRTMLDIATNGMHTDITKEDWHLVAGETNGKERYNLKKSGHPDELGHKLIAEYIDKYIRS